MAVSPRPIELLAPAADADIAIEAIKHGADAVYIGASSHGARKSASNSIEDIKRVVDFAHPFGVRVYVTVNTIVFDSEITEVEMLIGDLYRIGVDAIIAQDMGILRMNLPPIALHASTQCDTRTPEKARFLQDVGFSQIVLARELTLTEIKTIHNAVDVPLECFVHGALCVSYSGRCHISQATTGRSANRGECAQLCRWKYNLTDADGKVLTRDRHLLSLKDFNLSDRLELLLEAGASSFKIEGRLKDASYVRNIVAYYRNRLDEIIKKYPDKYYRSSFGHSEISFQPVPEKSFNRGFTHYFIDSRKPGDISSPFTPKSMGETISNVSELHNGDGISFFNSKGEYEGVMVNGVKGNKIIGNRAFNLPKGTQIHRTLDIQWQKQMSRATAVRKLRLDVKFNHNSVEATDERGTYVVISLPKGLEPAKKHRSIRDNFDKFGNTIYRLEKFDEDDFNLFIPASQLSEIRRNLLEALKAAAKATFKFDYRLKEDTSVCYPDKELDYRDNVANRLAESFYRSHGVEDIEPALETGKTAKKSNKILMTTRHCILREMGLCLKENPANRRAFRLPLTLSSGQHSFRLHFDCANCEMQVRSL